MAAGGRVFALRCLLQVGCLDTAPASSLGCLVSALSCGVLCCGDLEVRHRRDGEAYPVKAEGDKAIILMVKVCNTNR